MAGITAFNGNTGYRGVVKIEKAPTSTSRPDRTGTPPTNLVQLLATSGSFNMAHQAIYSTGVWGAGYMNASERVAYANDIVRLDGSVGLEYTAGDVFKALQAMCFTFRGDKGGTYIQILPNGVCGFQGFMWATSLSFSAAQGQVVTGDFNWTSYLDGAANKVITDDSSSDTVTENAINSPYGAAGASNGSQPPVTAPFLYNGLYPYWGTDVIGGSLSESNGDVTITWDSTPTPDIISWSASYDSSIEQLKCCGCKNGTYVDTLNDSKAPLAPDYLGIGPMSAQCQMEVFKLQTSSVNKIINFDDSSFHDRKAMRFILHTPADGAYTPMDLSAPNTYVIELPRIVYNSKQSSVQTGVSWITGQYSFDALGDFMGPPLNLMLGSEANS